MAVSLNVKENTDIREALFFGFAKANCPILMMTSSRVSLEDVFMELTADDEKARKEREAANRKRIMLKNLRMRLEKKKCRENLWI